MPELSPIHRADIWTDAVANYEALAEPHTREFAGLALAAAGGVAQGERVLDVAAGTGALTLQAARAGADVLAVDFSPGMVERLGERLREEKPRGRCEARVMDGQALDLPDSAFDAAFSVFGVMLFPDWKAGLRELCRVVRPGGRVVLVTWGQEEGAAPAILFNRAWRESFPGREPPPFPEGLYALSRPGGLQEAMQAAGCADVRVEAVARDWTMPSAAWLAEQAGQMFSQFPGWAVLNEGERGQLTARLRGVNGAAEDQPFAVRSEAFIGIGRKI